MHADFARRNIPQQFERHQAARTGHLHGQHKQSDESAATPAESNGLIACQYQTQTAAAVSGAKVCGLHVADERLSAAGVDAALQSAAAHTAAASEEFQQ